MRKYFNKISEQLNDEQYSGIEFLLIANFFAVISLVILAIIGFIFYG
jgi:hypothetical protein